MDDANEDDFWYQAPRNMATNEFVGNSGDYPSLARGSDLPPSAQGRTGSKRGGSFLPEISKKYY